MENIETLAYLDHNVLDLMTKGDPHEVKIFLRENKLTPVFSEETMKEIHRSKGYESVFLTLLVEIGAKYIEPVLDEKFKQTGSANIFTVNPQECYQQYLEKLSEFPGGDFGMSDLLMKFYGGKESTSFEELFSQGHDELQNYLKEILNDVCNDDISGEMALEVEKLKSVIEELPDILKTQTNFATQELSKLASSPVKSFEETTGIGPLVLKNITSPNVVIKIWDKICDKINVPDIELETFFGITPQDFEEDSGRERTLLEKVNAIYHQLNFIGYFRDSNMKKERRFRASFSDMTHAGIATFCHIFLCRDADLVMKTAAAYEYLGIETKIYHYKTNKRPNRKKAK